jgi:hypothetical protein
MIAGGISDPGANSTEQKEGELGWNDLVSEKIRTKCIFILERLLVIFFLL